MTTVYRFFGAFLGLQTKSVSVLSRDLVFFCHPFRTLKLTGEFILFEIRAGNRFTKLWFKTH